MPIVIWMLERCAPLGRNKSIHAVDMHLDQRPRHLADVPSSYDCTSQSAPPMLWSRAMHLPQDVLDRLLDTHRDDLDGAARSLRKHQLGQQTGAQRRRRFRACVQGGHWPRLLRCWPWGWGTATNPHSGMEMQLTQRPRVHNHHIAARGSHAAANLSAESPRQGQGHHRRPSQAVSGA